MAEVDCSQKVTGCTSIKTLEKRVSKIEDAQDVICERLRRLESNSAVSQQEIKMIFNILDEIKKSINIIADELGIIRAKPAEKDAAKWNLIINTIIAAGAGIIAGILFSQM